LRIISLRKSRVQQHKPRDREKQEQEPNREEKKEKRQSKATRNYAEDLGEQALLS
jgi:hypothetical protein